MHHKSEKSGIFKRAQFRSLVVDEVASDTSSSSDSDSIFSDEAPTDDDIQSFDKQENETDYISIKFVIISLLLTSLVSFSVGRTFRNIHLTTSTQRRTPMYKQFSSNGNSHTSLMEDSSIERKRAQLPPPTIIPGKEVPFTTYTSKHFQMSGSATSSTMHIVRSSLDETASLHEENCGESVCEHASHDTFLNANEHSHNTDYDGLHLPAGQHILVDIKDVDSEFLNSQERLANAMVELINESKLTLLSYHCHTLVPIGVSCAGVLLESHVAFHTWPSEGVISMDLFTCGGGLLIPVLPSIQKLFGVPRASEMDVSPDDIPDPTMLWAHKWRGFRDGFTPNSIEDYKEDEEHNTHQHQYLARDVLDILGVLDFDVKTTIVSTKTKFQSYDVYEVLNPQKSTLASYHRSLQRGGSYESNNPELFTPNRVLFLDGVTQSTRDGDASYHESIVHPALIAHNNPEKVAIIGGGEGATLREVLKHNTVKTAVMIEIDDEIVDLSKKYLPEWSDCSDIQGSAQWCFDDDRVEVRFEDAMAYFVNKFSFNEALQDEKYDVIIMDALDPNDGVEFATYLYTNEAFIDSLFNGLSELGILVVQVGEVPKAASPPEDIGAFENRAVMIKKLEAAGFASIHLYEEGHSGFSASWATLVAFRDERTESNWYRNGAEIEVQVMKRLRKSKSDKNVLRNFDGSTMMNYQVTPRVFETLYDLKRGASDEFSDTMSSVDKRVYSPILERMTNHTRQF